ncbi:MAG TPA: TolC family protein [Flavisolibacter sp.]|jgi:outer membrane protein|nr:TolC family protein [Flavisolibacter sp.]
MKYRWILLFLMACSFLSASAQQKWSLEQCVTYAMANNISVKQSDVQSRITALQTKLNLAGRYPLLNFSGSGGYNFGRSINPATNQFENNSIFFNNYQLQSSVNLFNWFSQQHAIAASKLDQQAAEAAVDKARNDVALNVAVGYLQALLANEQTEISRIQIGQTQAQLDVIRKQVNAGSLPELNAIELEAQLARDSATYIGTLVTYQQNLIQLKALLNLDMDTPFDIEKPDISTIPVESLAELQPAAVYQEALKNLPQQRVNQFRYQAALKNIKFARSSMFPTLSAFANIGSRYSSLFPDQSSIVTVPTGKVDTLGRFEVTPGVNQYIVRDNFQVITRNLPFGNQIFDVNLSQAIGLNLSIPIFNGRQLRTNWERAKLNAESIQIQVKQDNLTLQSDIYNAHVNAVNAQQRFIAAQKGVQASERAFGFSQKRFQAGLLQTIELITNQNNLYRARLDAASAQYEYVFRMKLLEFYKGRGLKL